MCSTGSTSHLQCKHQPVHSILAGCPHALCAVEALCHAPASQHASLLAPLAFPPADMELLILPSHDATVLLASAPDAGKPDTEWFSTWGGNPLGPPPLMGPPTEWARLEGRWGAELRTFPTAADAERARLDALMGPAPVNPFCKDAGGEG
jgi:hypothetical protein